MECEPLACNFTFAYELLLITLIQINSRSIQDMYIFGDPSRVPIVIVERVMNIPRRTNSENSYLRHVDLRESLTSQVDMSSVAVDKQSAPKSTARLLKIVVFVHGFQASPRVEFILLN